MPELPEVENIAAGLRSEIIGERIEQVTVKVPKIVKGPFQRHWRKFIARCPGLEITGVLRRAKRLIITSSGRPGLLVQLGMTGKFLLSSAAGKTLARHNCFTIVFQSGKKLRYYDVRRFGRLWLLEDIVVSDLDKYMEQAGLGRLGPEPFELNSRKFSDILQNKRMIKTLLLDQTRIAGLGNIYADESLFAAGIHPERRCDSLDGEEVSRLCRSIKSILKRAIRYGGTTFSDYRNAYGDMGRFQEQLKVYQRTGQPCLCCGTVIARTIISGRSSHFCPECQI